MATPNDNNVPNTHQEVLDEKLREQQRLDSETSSATKAEDRDGAPVAENAPNSDHPHARFGGADRVISANDADVADLPNVEKAGTYDKIELTEDMCYDELGYSFPEWKKWYAIFQLKPN